MKVGKLVTLALLAALGWQHQAMLGEKVALIRSLPDLTNTYMEMRTYRIRLARQVRERGQDAPSNFQRWLDSHFDSDAEKRPSVDYFGTPYRLEQRHMQGIKIRSCGLDGRCQTSDDLVMEV